MYQTILVPLDGSSRAEVIISHVEGLAQRFKARVIFVHVLEPSGVTMGPHGSVPEIDLELVKARSAEMDRYLSGWHGEFREKGIKSSKRLVYGSVVEKIIEVAEQEQVDLIAMASHGRSGLQRVFYGSVAAGLLQMVDRPLLLVRSRRS